MPGHWSVRRLVSLAAVAMLHAAIVLGLIVALQVRIRLSSTPEPISAAILPSTAPASSASASGGRPPSANPRAPRIPIGPMSIAAPDFALPSAPGASIDWDAEAARAAAAVSSRPKIHEFGQVRKAQFSRRRTPPPRTRLATSTGTSTVGSSGSVIVVTSFPVFHRLECPRSSPARSQAGRYVRTTRSRAGSIQLRSAAMMLLGQPSECGHLGCSEFYVCGSITLEISAQSRRL